MKEKESIEECVGKYLVGGEKQSLDETQETSSSISIVRSKLSGAQKPEDIIILGALLSLLGVSLIVSNQNLKNPIKSMVRSLVGKL